MLPGTQMRAERMDWHMSPHFSVPSPPALRTQAESLLISACVLLESLPALVRSYKISLRDFEYTPLSSNTPATRFSTEPIHEFNACHAASGR